MKEEIKSLYLAIFFSMLVIFGVNYFLPAEPSNLAPEQTEISESQISVPAQEMAEQVQTKSEESYNEAINDEVAAVAISTPSLNGRINLSGARIDLLKLNKYKQTLDVDSPEVELFSPANSKTPYFAETGWLSSDTNIKLPNSKTIWKTNGTELTPNNPITFEYNNNQGLRFIRTVSVDDNYLFTIKDTVENNTDSAIVLYPYGLISRTINPDEQQTRSVVHEGISSVIDGSLHEFKLKDIKQNKPETFETSRAWAGFSDRYWFSAFILDTANSNNLKFAKTAENTYQADYRGAAETIAAGGVATQTVRFFAGAKEIKLLDEYAHKQNIEKFDLAVDFGWYYFLTKPFFYVLDFLYNIIGNMGWAILLFAALLRLAMFPVANKSYDSMSKMKKLQPKIQELQEKYKGNTQLLQQATMELYRREKINPASGCLPMFIQIPVFFSLYKVLNISIEIRHAPFIGWIKDLSAPDPLTISAWSHIPLPALVDVGVWPILMGITMWVQQKLNPAPANKDQARMFAILPIIFTFMLGHFASGLVIYWTLSNILSIIQQKAIMRKNGVK